MLARLNTVYVAYSVRGQVDLTVLLVRQLVLAALISCQLTPLPTTQNSRFTIHLPLIQPHIVLDEKQILIWKVRGPQSGTQVDLL